ncbi:SRPBCC family protein [soil metagenome]
MSKPETNRIEKQIVLQAPPSRVWRALTDVQEFGAWFGVELAGRFAPGARLTGQVTNPGYEHLIMDITIEDMEPERLLSWRWPFEAGGEAMTRVVFELEPVPEGTRLTIVESGFDRLPLERRAEAYRGNEEGWTAQMQQIERHVAASRAG